MDDKTIYLHIGWSKTATTTIQSGLEINAEKLKAYNYLIPRSGFDQGQHHNLAYQLLEIKGHHYFHPKYGTLDDLAEEIQASEYKKFIVSSEIFHNAGAHHITQLHEKISPLGEVKVVVFLRKPDEYLASMWIELVKKGMYKNSFEQYLQEKMGQYLYLDVLNRWAKIFDEPNLIVKTFDKTEVNEHVFIQFLRACEFAEVGDLGLPESKNISPSAKEFAIVQQIFNAIKLDYFPKIVPGYFFLNKVMGFSKQHHWDRSDRISVLNAENTAMIWEKFSEENEILTRQFFGDERKFSPPNQMPKANEESSLDEIDAQELLSLGAFLINEVMESLKS